MTENIRDLALQAMQGSAPAFQELYRLTRQGAWFVALSITKNEHDAQDILQESYLKAYQSMAQLAQPESFAAWLNQIVANKAKNYVSRIKPDSFAQYEDESAGDWQEETNPAFIPDEHLDQAEAKALIASLVNELPEDQRLVVLLRYYDDMDVAAIAKSLEIPEGTVKSRLGRARQKLAAMLELAQGKGLRLYAAAPIPLLAYFIKLLGFDAQGSDRLPPLLIGSAGTAAAGGAAAAGKAAAKAARKAASAGKIAALAATVIVAVGGITAAGVYAYRRTAPAGGTTAAPTTVIATAAPTSQAATEVRSEAVVTTQAPPDTRMTSARPLPQAPPAATTSPEVTRTQTSTAAATAGPTTARSTTTTRRASWSYTPLPTRPTVTQTTTQATTTATASGTTTTRFIDTPRPPTTANPTTVTTAEPTTTATEPALPDFEYARDPAGGYVVTKYNGSETDLTVPASIDGVAVIHLGAGAFEGTNVVRVVIEPGFDCLRDRTFADCPGLIEVVVPNTVVNVLGSPFTGSPNVVVVCGENSRAHTYCRTNGIAFRLA
ncbi:MAG: sigma-70 family RNA polymerase sigma factor [Oscillospiraceae bacterium]|nr:sigma-70 family RNA polymerase sigma factor [Oscillospiraceae bacterium]